MFVLRTDEQVVYSRPVVEFVRDDIGRDAPEVALGEELRAERGVHVAVLQDIDRREGAAVVLARFVLVGVGEAQRIGGPSVEELRVELRRDRGEVAHLIVARILEIEGVIGEVVAVLAVTGVDRIVVERGGGVARIVRVLGVGAGETDRKPVLVVDVPVEPGHELVAGGLDRIAGIASRVVSVGVDQVVAQGVHIRSQGPL